MLRLFPDTPGNNRNLLKNLNSSYVKSNCPGIGDKLFKENKVANSAIDYTLSLIQGGVELAKKAFE